MADMWVVPVLEPVSRSDKRSGKDTLAAWTWNRIPAIVACLMLFLGATPGGAELKPEEIVLVATVAGSTSRSLAHYYASARGVPASQIMLLNVRPGSDMNREVWEKQLRPAIRNWLIQQKLQDKVRCLVTCWDVPLRIGSRSDKLPAVVQRKAFLERARAERVERCRTLADELAAIAAEAKPKPQAAWDVAVPLKQLTGDIEGRLKEAKRRLALLLPEPQARELPAFERSMFSAIGLVSLHQTMLQADRTSPLPPAARERNRGLQEEIETIERKLRPLVWFQADTAARDEKILPFMERLYGLLGAVQWIDQQRELLAKNETAASFDSELSLLFWPDYDRIRWRRNLLHYHFDPETDKPVTLMVSRLAAPQPSLVTKLIDASIAVEKAGLKGKVYLDARGLPGEPRPGSYGQYDQSLRDLADRLRKHTSLEVVLDNRPELLAPGTCPEAALYCGWYSLTKYVDAFTWQPGAVGYHMASGEAGELLRPGNSQWCPAMLERGVAATLGPTFEPYLAAFPPPDDFFPLLLTGRYSLVETYYRTCPFTSWAMVLVGDPLYRPFRVQPPLAEQDLPERMKKMR